jgi:hypothetical protein
MIGRYMMLRQLITCWFQALVVGSGRMGPIRSKLVYANPELEPLGILH